MLLPVQLHWLCLKDSLFLYSYSLKTPDSQFIFSVVKVVLVFKISSITLAVSNPRRLPIKLKNTLKCSLSLYEETYCPKKESLRQCCPSAIQKSFFLLRLQHRCLSLLKVVGHIIFPISFSLYRLVKISFVNEELLLSPSANIPAPSVPILPSFHGVSLYVLSTSFS